MGEIILRKLGSRRLMHSFLDNDVTRKSSVSIQRLCTTSVKCTLCLASIASQSYGLDDAVDAVNAEFFWQQGYTGSGVEIGVIDLHLGDSTHPAIDGNYLGSQNFINGAGWLSGHATAVTGAALSQDLTRLGVAHGAGWWTGQTTNKVGISPKQEAMTVSVETFAQGLGVLNGNPAEVVTMSIGVNGSDTANDQWSLALDHIVGTAGTTVVVAAGNDGPASSSFPGPPGAAYNILSVGATGGTGAVVSKDYTRIAPYSSRGPTTDGRSKPDIVAPGSLIELPTLIGTWSVVSGTSFAAPIVAGGAALLIDMGLDRGLDVDAKVIKSVLMNSADKLSGWSHTSIAPLDPNLGAGQMNLEAAFYQYDAGEQGSGIVSPLGWDHGTLQGTTANTYEIGALVPGGAELSATLTWNRDVTTDVEDIESAVYTASTFENLELFLYNVDDLAMPVASSISPLDNVEHLFLSSPTTGNYIFEVRSASGAVASPLSYSLAWDIDVPEMVTAGDFDIDGDVDGADFLKWQRGELSNPLSSSDLANWQASFGDVASSVAAASTAVPEPSSFVLLLAALLFATTFCSFTREFSSPWSLGRRPRLMAVDSNRDFGERLSI